MRATNNLITVLTLEIRIAMICALDNDTPILNASPHWVVTPSLSEGEIPVCCSCNNLTCKKLF